MTSSLQRAAAQQDSASRKGAFESSFVAGLDLSEFGTTTTAPQQSASALLLAQKQREAQQAAFEQEKEERIQALAKLRGKELAVSQQQKRVKIQQDSSQHDALHSTAAIVMKNTNIGDTLILLHDTDVHGGSSERQKIAKSKRNAIRQTKRRQVSTSSKVKSKQKRVMKKSQRSKY